MVSLALSQQKYLNFLPSSWNSKANKALELSIVLRLEGFIEKISRPSQAVVDRVHARSCATYQVDVDVLAPYWPCVLGVWLKYLHWNAMFNK